MHEVVPPNLPGHAGGFETSLVLALRPDLVQLHRRQGPRVQRSSVQDAVEHDAFERAGGITDDTAHASAAAEERLPDAIIGAVADCLVDFWEHAGRTT